MGRRQVEREGESSFPTWIKWTKKSGVERENWREKEKKKRRGVRSSTFSLRLKEIEPSIFVGAREKVHPHDKSFV